MVGRTHADGRRTLRQVVRARALPSFDRYVPLVVAAGAVALSSCWLASGTFQGEPLTIIIGDPSSVAPHDLPVGRALFAARFIFTDNPGRPECHASTLVQLESGDLLAAWYAGLNELSRDTAIQMSRRPAGAQEWLAPELVVDSPSRSLGNPVLYAEGQRVWLFYASVYGTGWAASELFFQVSEDGARSWTGVRELHRGCCELIRCKPIRLADGRLLLPGYSEAVPSSFFWHSRDDGWTWQRTRLIFSEPGNIQPAVVQLASGRLLAMMRCTAGGQAWVSYSDDSGSRWAALQLSGLPNPGSALDMIRLSNGHLVLAYNDSTEQRTPLSVALSFDEGRNWPFKREVEAGQGSFSYPSLAEGSGGQIHMTYSYNRQYIKHVTFNEAWIASGP